MTFLNTLTEIAIPVTSIAILKIAGEVRIKTNKKRQENETQAEVWSLSRKREQISNRAIKSQKRGDIFKIGTFIVCRGEQ